jgi:hypothetical protein
MLSHRKATRGCVVFEQEQIDILDIALRLESLNE